MADIALQNVTKEFPGGTFALDDLSLDVPDGEFLILVGPSGCGKTTALRLIAGLEKPTSGQIRIGERVVNGVSPRDRDIAMVFQNYALYPHMTVYRNLAFGLKERRTPKREIDRRVREISTVLSLDELLKRRPAQLSGGQRQRVAMGRALVREPKVFLLDEPLSNLDAKLRVQMRAELKRLHQKLGITTVYVTHDQVEAMTLADRIVVMSAGKAQQIGPPQEVFRRPANIFVAGFIGSPAMNLIRGYASGGQISAGELSFRRNGVPDGEVVVGLRPESLIPLHADRPPGAADRLSRAGDRPSGAGDRPSRAGNRPSGAADGPSGAADAPSSQGALPSLELDVDLVEPLGESALVHGTVAGTIVRSGAEEEKEILVGGSSRAPVTAIFAAADQPATGDRVRIGIEPDRIYLFDSQTGQAIP